MMANVMTLGPPLLVENKLGRRKPLYAGGARLYAGGAQLYDTMV